MEITSVWVLTVHNTYKGDTDVFELDYTLNDKNNILKIKDSFGEETTFERK